MSQTKLKIIYYIYNTTVFLGTNIVYVDPEVGRFQDSTSDEILTSHSINSRSSCLLCERNIVDATLFFSSTIADYQMLDSGISYNYSYWASQCKGRYRRFTKSMCADEFM